MRVRPFRALVPPPDLAARVACVPYDVIDREEASVMAADEPLSLLHVDRAEIDLSRETDPYAPEVYARAAANLARLREVGALVREERAHFYLYRMRMGDHEQVGVAGLSSVEDYERGAVRRHERTRPEKEDDRTRLIETIGAQTGPVLLAYRDEPALDALQEAVVRGAPQIDFEAPDGVRHTVWKVAETGPVEEAFGRVQATYIADGHHRAASAARVAAARDARGAGCGEAHRWFLSVLYPASQLLVMPYHRLVRDLGGRIPEQFLEEVAERFDVRADAPPSPSRPGTMSMYLAGRWFGLSWPSPVVGIDPASALDVSVLQDRLLGPILGIEDPRTDPRIGFLGGIRGTTELRRRVDAGEASVAFSLYPTTVEQVMATADAGRIMPPKSTWFEPKLRSGLFVHLLED